MKTIISSLSAAIVVAGLAIQTQGCKQNQASQIKEDAGGTVPAACTEKQKKVNTLTAELKALQGQGAGSGTSTATGSVDDRPGTGVTENDCQNKAGGLLRGDQCTCMDGSPVDPRLGEFCDDRGIKVDGLANMPLGGFENRKTCILNGGEYVIADNGCRCANSEMIYNTFDIRQWCRSGRPNGGDNQNNQGQGSGAGSEPLNQGQGNQDQGGQGQQGTQGVGNDVILVDNSAGGGMGDSLALTGGVLAEPPTDEGFSLADRTPADVEKELAAAKADLDACIKANQAGTDGCSRSGGQLDAGGTCRCSNGVAVFKLRNETCEQHMKKQKGICTSKGGFILYDDDICRCFPDYEAVPQGGVCAMRPPSPGEKGACIFVSKANSKQVHETCKPDSTHQECNDFARTVFVSGEWEPQLVAGKSCDDAKRQFRANGGQSSQVYGACVVVEKATKKVQETCFDNTTQDGCRQSIRTVYENVSPGKFEGWFYSQVGCTAAKEKARAQGGTGTQQPAATQATQTAQTPKATSCYCGVDRTHKWCIAARKKYYVQRRRTYYYWETLAQVQNPGSCTGPCDQSTGSLKNTLNGSSCQ